MIKIKPSLLRHTATIQRKVSSKDSEGLESYEWEDVHTEVPCRVKSISGSEMLSSNQLINQIISEITIHHISPIDPSMRIVVNNKNNYIKSIMPDEYDNMFFKIMTQQNFNE